MKRNDYAVTIAAGWCLRDPQGDFIPQTFDTTKQASWMRGFEYIAGSIPGFRERYWKRLEPSQRAARRLGFRLVRVRFREGGGR